MFFLFIHNAIFSLFLTQSVTINTLIVAFLGSGVGLGIGWLVWGNLVRSLVGSFDTVSSELEMLKQHSLAQKYGTNGQMAMTADELYTENVRLNQYIKQMETDRNRVLSELKTVQKQVPDEAVLESINAYHDLQRERNHLWKELLEAKKQAEIMDNKLAVAADRLKALRDENESLDDLIADEMYALRLKFLNASDDLDKVSHHNKTLLEENKTLADQKKHWQNEYEQERKISTALSAQIANIRVGMPL
jgi:chromosome segregation ATPase